MDFLDYREKLGIGFSDKTKYQFFTKKMLNVMRRIVKDSNFYNSSISFEEYCTFCNTAGIELEHDLAADFAFVERFTCCINYIFNHSNCIEEFLSYYLAFVNSIEITENRPWNRIEYVNLITTMMNESHIPYELLEEKGEYYIFPKGVPEMDKALVSEPLDWLSKYPNAQKAYSKALREYAELTDVNASDVADKFRKALETFFREFFCVDKALENCKKEYGIYLKAHGIPAEIACNFETLLQAYTNYINGYAKHQDRTSRNVLEYLMYQTGNIIRLLITLKQEEEENAH